jgi:hypothetical protein
MKLPPELNNCTKIKLVGGPNNFGYFDYSYFPIITIYYVGTFSDEIIHQAYALRELSSRAAHEQKTGVVVVMGVDEARVPPATTRKLAGEYAKRDKTEVGYIRGVNVVTNRLMRGALTAVTWLTGDASSPLWATSYVDGVAKAKEIYESQGLPLPPIPDDYTFPELSEFEEMSFTPGPGRRIEM